ncbi:MAG: hypothetical protein IPK99_09535 [Flavobacteriales bacterium]|nr:hypothetical protein [Flavobacteriales bacterium]
MLLGSALVAGNAMCGQNIGINANGATPNASALLDIDASAIAGTKKGLLIPRMTSPAREAPDGYWCSQDHHQRLLVLQWHPLDPALNSGNAG